MKLVIRVFNNERFDDYLVENQKKISIGSNKHDTITINGSSLKKRHLIFKNKKEIWTAICKGIVLYHGNEIKNICIEDGQLFVLDKENRIAVAVMIDDNSNKSCIDLNLVDEITIGRHKNCNIVLNNKKISNNHAKIYRVGAEYHISDIESTNGTYVNNKLIRDVILKDNDEIVINRYKFLYKSKQLILKNADGNTNIRNIIRFERDLKENPIFKRSPRLKLDIPSGDIDIQAAPSIGSKPEINWMSVLLPAFGMVGVMGIIGIITGMIGTLLYTAPMSVIGVLVSVTSYTSQKKKHKIDEKLRIEKYTEYTSSVVKDIESNVNEQLKAMTLADPDTSICFNIARNIERRLWERKPRDADFGSIRIGSGDTDFCMEIKIPNTGLTLESDDFINLPKQIQDKYKTIHGIPVCYDSLEDPKCGIVGNRKSIINLVKNIVVQATTQHCYTEFKVVTLYPAEEKKDFEWMRWLPHSFDDDKGVRYMADSIDGAKEIFKYFDEIFKQREREIKDKGSYSTKKIKLPYYLFIVASSEFVDNQSIMKYLELSNAQMGVATLFVSDDIGKLPDNCSMIIDVKSEKGAIYNKNNIAAKTFFSFDDTSLFDFEQFARDLFPIKVPNTNAGSSLPSCITFLEGYKVKTPNQIPIKKHWKEATAYKSLSVPIGVKANGEQFKFDIHEKMHGPHGLVAGTTGSGKSEMVQSWILSMALHFSPNDVSFVLIDFKGTGLILPFMNLPHLAGTISDLDKNINRNLIALKNELLRRKMMFDDAGVKNINEYLKLYKNNKVSEPLPYLFIVIDEFAEFKSQFPDFGKATDSILRTGRTLGVFSILLMQKPTGVVSDQSESNVKFRWCLKVASPSDSREMLLTTDAAQISNPGRAYVKVSNEGALDYIYELVQSYWSGAPYNPNRKEKATVKPRISVVDLSGKRIAYDVQEKTMGFKSDINEIDAIVKYIQNVAQENGEIKAKQIWDAKLPFEIFLDEIRKSIFDGESWGESQKHLAPVIGMIDAPKSQRQYPLTIDFTNDGHTVIYGAPGTGKTTLLSTLLISLCTSYKPDEVSIYVMDFGGWNMGIYRDFPHIGGIANDNESEKIEKLIRLLSRELDKRKHKFANEGVGNILSYRESSDEKIPYVVLVLDNFTPVFNLYPDLEEFFINLTREGGNYGIYFVTVTNNLMGLGYKIGQNIKNAIALQMSDKSDYSQIVGSNDGLEPEKTPGRGLAKGNSPLEVQIALPIKGISESDRTSRIKKLANKMNETWNGERAKAIPVMPEIIHYRSIESNNIILGLSSQDIESVEISFENSHYILISGKPQSGKSNMIKVISKQLQSERTIIFDNNASLKSLKNDNCKYCSDASSFDEYIAELVPELENRRKTFQNDENAKFDRICILIDDLKQCFDSVTDETIKRLYAVIRIGKGLNVIVIVAGMYDEISRLSNQGEQFSCNLLSGYHSILLGGCANDHDVFKINNLSFNEKSATLDENEGYIVVREKALRFKTMYEK